MRAARLHAYGRPMQIDDLPQPRPDAGQVVVRVEGAGFCHSDLHIISGEIQALPRLPLTLGHENAGTVAAIGTPVLVIGCGALGQFGVKILRLFSGAEIIAVDLDDRKLATAREAGATHTLNGKDPDAAGKILELARGIGVSAAFDFVGADSTLALALTTTRTHGRVVQVGLAGGTAHVAALKTVKPEVSVSISWWGNIRELREVIALVEGGRLTPIPLEFWPLDRINEVYDLVHHGQVAGRAVITP